MFGEVSGEICGLVWKECYFGSFGAEIRRCTLRDDRREVDWYYRTYLGEFRELSLDPYLP